MKSVSFEGCSTKIDDKQFSDRFEKVAGFEDFSEWKLYKDNGLQRKYKLLLKYDTSPLETFKY